MRWDEIGNQADLPIAERATDTAGATLVNFAPFDLVGMQLPPRIRDLGRIPLCRTGSDAGGVVQGVHGSPAAYYRRRASASSLRSSAWLGGGATSSSPCSETTSATSPRRSGRSAKPPARLPRAA